MKPQRVLVTGASKGIGFAIAQHLSQQGYQVVAHYHSDRLGAEQAVAQGSGYSLGFDVADEAQCRTLIEQDISEHGAYYGVISNAGIRRDGLFAGQSYQDWRQVLSTNLDSFYHVINPCLMPMIRRRQPGRIITLASLSGVEGNAGQVNYSAAKGGLIAASKALALELAKRKITVNTVAPGLIDTPMTQAGGIPDALVEAIPMGRMGSAEEVASLVGYLLSEGAAYITRQVIRVDGGC